MNAIEYAEKMRAERLRIEPDINKTINAFVDGVESAIQENDVPAGVGVDVNLLINAAEILKKDRWTPIEEGLPEIPGNDAARWVEVIVTDRYRQSFPLMYCRERVRGEVVCRWRWDLDRLYYGDVVAWRYMPEAWKGGET